MENYSVKYYVADNYLNNDKSGTKIAVPISLGSLNDKMLVDLTDELGTTFKPQEVAASLSLLTKVAVAASRKGYTLNLGLFGTSFSMTGLYNADGSPAEGEHRFKINVHKGSELRTVEKEMRTEKTIEPAEKLKIQTVRDSETKTVNDKLTPRGAVEVYGRGLKIEGDDPKCGLWFTDEAGKDHKAGNFVGERGNSPSSLYAMIPDLKDGQYQVKVTTQYATGNKPLKEPKTDVFKTKLTVKKSEGE